MTLLRLLPTALLGLLLWAPLAQAQVVERPPAAQACPVYGALMADVARHRDRGMLYLYELQWLRAQPIYRYASRAIRQQMAEHVEQIYTHPGARDTQIQVALEATCRQWWDTALH